MYKFLAKLNVKVISNIAGILATSACVWAFLALSLLPIAWVKTMAIVQFVSSGILQLVALPILGVQNRIESAKLAQQMEEQHIATMAILKELHQMHTEFTENQRGRGIA